MAYLIILKWKTQIQLLEKDTCAHRITGFCMGMVQLIPKFHLKKG